MTLTVMCDADGNPVYVLDLQGWEDVVVRAVRDDGVRENVVCVVYGDGVYKSGTFPRRLKSLSVKGKP